MAHLFISYSRENRELVDRLRNDLEQAGLNIWIDKEGLKVGSINWEQVLRDAIEGSSAVLVMVSPSSRRSTYVNAEIAVATSAKKTIYPIFIAGDSWVDSIPFELIMRQAIDLRGESYNQNLPQLITALQVQSSSTVPPVETRKPIQNLIAEPRNPYKGLRAFRAEDKDDFFGREELIGDLLKLIGDGKGHPRLRAVLGASGSGKSSVMMAGVLPKLQEAHPDWVFLDPIVPSSQPLDKLGVALARKLPAKSHTAMRQDLNEASARGLHLLACEISDKPVVLYIDQFEEVFTLVDKDAERRQFIDLLTTAVTESAGIFYLLLSMRADFYDRPFQYEELGQLIEHQHLVVAPMSLTELFNVVNLPAQLPDVQLQFEQGLATEMVYEVRQEASALPLLQFTLDQLFQQREGQVLSLKGYQGMGGVKGALAKHADATFDKLPSEQHKVLARALFLRLIEAGATEQDTTRRHAKAAELNLPSMETTRILQDVANHFVDARLLTSDQTGSEPTLEVSHEALIREWKRLGDWLREAREDLRVQKSIQSDVAEWLRRGKADDLLYRGGILTEAQGWAERNNASRNETMFLNEGVRVQAAQKAQEQRQSRTLRYAFFGLLAVIVVASLGLALIFSQNNSNLVIEASTLQAQANYQAALIDFSQERQYALSFDNLTQTPAADFFATATAYAAFVTPVPVIETFDEIEMVLVPRGCFYIGSKENPNEQPVQEICFDEAFWIDKTEVTQGDFARLGGVQAENSNFDGENRPVEQITWFEARDFCALRGGSLPTEAEWEYAARAPSRLVYPWGNEWNEDNSVWNRSESQGTADVGSIPAGASWVGALDMSGNVWEWTRSVYADYPYNAADGREEDRGESTDAVYSLRGGSWSSYNTGSLRSATRFGGNPDGWDSYLGFRCVRAYNSPES